MAWPRDAYVGQKVVCVHIPADYPRRAKANRCMIPAVGDTYTLREVDVCDGVVCCKLTEIVNRNGPWVLEDGRVEHDEPSFNCALFRPVEPQKPARSTETGMSTLRALLKAKPARKPVGEGV